MPDTSALCLIDNDVRGLAIVAVRSNGAPMASSRELALSVSFSGESSSLEFSCSGSDKTELGCGKCDGVFSSGDS